MTIDFELAVKTSAEKALLRIIQDGSWIKPDYSNRFKIPADFLAGVWGLVDHDRVKAAMATRIEAELAGRIINHMAAEISTDVKQILSVKERREAIRELAMQNITAIMKSGAGHE